MSTVGGTIQAQINMLGEHFDRGIGEIKVMLVGYEERMRGLENREAGSKPMMTARLDAAWNHIDEHDQSLKQITSMITKLAEDQIVMTNQVKTLQSILVWALGLFTPVLIGVIIAFATGEAQVVFK